MFAVIKMSILQKIELSDFLHGKQEMQQNYNPPFIISEAVHTASMRLHPSL